MRVFWCLSDLVALSVHLSACIDYRLGPDICLCYCLSLQSELLTISPWPLLSDTNHILLFTCLYTV